MEGISPRPDNFAAVSMKRTNISKGRESIIVQKMTTTKKKSNRIIIIQKIELKRSSNTKESMTAAVDRSAKKVGTFGTKDLYIILYVGRLYAQLSIYVHVTVDT